ncbi:MAG: hypothetical protein E7Z62_08045 [Thermoplasmata archaeon]|nr:hypothetical protein [Thermoplasmata archaeon]
MPPKIPPQKSKQEIKKALKSTDYSSEVGLDFSYILNVTLEVEYTSETYDAKCDGSGPLYPRREEDSADYVDILFDDNLVAEGGEGEFEVSTKTSTKVNYDVYETFSTKKTLSTGIRIDTKVAGFKKHLLNGITDVLLEPKNHSIKIIYYYRGNNIFEDVIQHNLTTINMVQYRSHSVDMYITPSPKARKALAKARKKY